MVRVVLVQNKRCIDFGCWRLGDALKLLFNQDRLFVLRDASFKRLNLKRLVEVGVYSSVILLHIGLEFIG